MKTKDGFIQGYNAQAAVDRHAQIIVAHTLVNASTDQAQLAPLLTEIKANMGRNPDEVSADAGYCSAANLRTLARRRIEAYVATGRQRHGTPGAVATRQPKPGIVARRQPSSKEPVAAADRWQKQCRTVFGQIKQARGFSSSCEASTK